MFPPQLSASCTLVSQLKQYTLPKKCTKKKDCEVNHYRYSTLLETNISHQTRSSENHRLKSAGIVTGYVIVPRRVSTSTAVAVEFGSIQLLGFKPTSSILECASHPSSAPAGQLLEVLNFHGFFVGGESIPLGPWVYVIYIGLFSGLILYKYIR